MKKIGQVKIGQQRVGGKVSSQLNKHHHDTGGTPSVPAYAPQLDFSDGRNSQYLVISGLGV